MPGIDKIFGLEGLKLFAASEGGHARKKLENHCLKVMILQCLDKCRILYMRAAPQVRQQKRVKQTPGETPAVRKKVKLVYFPSVILVPQVGRLLLKMYLFVKSVP